MSQPWQIETLAIQGGYTPKSGEPRILPINQSTTFKYESGEHVADLFDLKVAGHMYTRISNPTVEAFEGKIAAMEGGVGALATSSGQAAITLALLNLCKQGDHIVSSNTIYGGSFALISNTLSKFGVEVTFVDPGSSKEEILAVFKENTKVLYGETIGNPGLNVLDFDKFAAIAKEKDVPFIVDNTFATPILCNPLKLGANIVVHSCTKYIDGHATSVGGIIVDGGNYNWDNGKFSDFTEPDESYHGLKYVEQFKEAAFIVKARVQLLRDIGASPSPFNAWLFNLGTETLHLRMERHSENALKIAKFLEKHDKVSWVNYPGLESHETYDLGQKYLKKGSSGVLSFGLKGGKGAGIKLINGVKLINLVVHVCDARTSIIHPASTTHRQLSEEAQLESGITPDLIRLSVGIENVDDLIAELEEILSTL